MESLGQKKKNLKETRKLKSYTRKYLFNTKDAVMEE